MTTKNRTDIGLETVAALATSGQGVLNVLSDFETMDNVNRSIHALWYQNAYSDVVSLACEFGKPVNVVAAIVATLSPSIRWSENLRGARIVLESVKSGIFSRQNGIRYIGYGANVDKAFLIARTGDTSYCHGPKVESFLDNIMSKGCGNTVTIDRHALGTILGLPKKQRTGDLVPTKAAYPVCVQMYIDATEIINAKYNSALTPKQVQAICWAIRSDKTSLY